MAHYPPSPGTQLDDLFQQVKSQQSAGIVSAVNGALSNDSYTRYTFQRQAVPYTETTALIRYIKQKIPFWPKTLQDVESRALVLYVKPASDPLATSGTPYDLDTGEQLLEEMTLSVYEKKLYEFFTQQQLQEAKTTVRPKTRELAKKILKEGLWAGGPNKKKTKIISKSTRSLPCDIIVVRGKDTVFQTSNLVAVKRITVGFEALCDKDELRGVTDPKQKWRIVLEQWRGILKEIDLQDQCSKICPYVVPIYNYYITDSEMPATSQEGEDLVDANPPPQGHQLFIEIGMRYIPNTLLDLIRLWNSKRSNDQQSLPAALRWQMLVQLLQALETIHAHGVYHLDFTCQNIFIEFVDPDSTSASTSSNPKDGDQAANVTPMNPLTQDADTRKISYPLRGTSFLIGDFGESKTSATIRKRDRRLHRPKGFWRSRHKKTVLSEEEDTDRKENYDVQLLFCSLIQLTKGLDGTDDTIKLSPHYVKANVFNKLAEKMSYEPEAPPFMDGKKTDHYNTVGLTDYEIKLGLLVFGNSIDENELPNYHKTSTGMSARALLSYMLSRTPDGSVIK